MRTEIVQFGDYLARVKNTHTPKSCDDVDDCFNVPRNFFGLFSFIFLVISFFGIIILLKFLWWADSERFRFHFIFILFIECVYFGISFECVVEFGKV